jgi:tetratricopeptide (TPR) repeat protein
MRLIPGFTIWRIALILPVILALTAARTSADQVDWNRSISRRLIGDAADGRLDQFSLLEAALIAGGASTSLEVDRAVRQFEKKFEPLAKKVAGQSAGKQRVQAVFECLHQEFLHGDYRADYSELHRTLADGHFNCVTATILFRHLCERLAVPSEIVASSGHVLCRVPEASNQFIETTCPECHPPTDRHWEQPNEVVKEQELRVISDVELVGKVYYNRGVAALEAKQFSQAADLLSCAWQFDNKDQATHDNLLATLNNWALAACDSADYKTASELILRGFTVDRSYPPLQSNDLHIHQQWVKSLCNRQQFAEAVEVLDTVIRRHPAEQAFIHGRLAVYGRWAESLFVANEFAAGWNKLEQARAQISADDKRAKSRLADAETAAVLAANEKLMQSGRVAQAGRLIEQALARFPDRSELLRRKLDLPTAKL